MTRAASLGVALVAASIACRASPPGKLEQVVMTTLKVKVTVGGKSDRNPLEGTEENVRKGRADFSHYCMVCHGLDGQNTGVPFADRMSPPVPPLSSPAVQRYSDGQLKWVIENGIFPSGMPASRGLLNDEEMWRIVVYLRHLPPAGSLGEPAVYVEPARASAR